MRIAADKAMVQLGADADVVLARSQLEELLVLAHRTVFHGDVVVNGSLKVLGNATVNGISMGGGSDDEECGVTFMNCQEAFEAGCPAGVCVVSVADAVRGWVQQAGAIHASSRVAALIDSRASPHACCGVAGSTYFPTATQALALSKCACVQVQEQVTDLSTYYRGCARHVCGGHKVCRCQHRLRGPTDSRALHCT